VPMPMFTVAKKRNCKPNVLRDVTHIPSFGVSLKEAMTMSFVVPRITRTQWISRKPISFSQRPLPSKRDLLLHQTALARKKTDMLRKI
jgi:hypothetical protein